MNSEERQYMAYRIYLERKFNDSYEDYFRKDIDYKYVERFFFYMKKRIWDVKDDVDQIAQEIDKMLLQYQIEKDKNSIYSVEVECDWERIDEILKSYFRAKKLERINGL